MGVAEKISLSAGPMASASASASDGVEVRSRLATAVDPVLWRDWQALADRACEPNSFAEPWFVDASLRTIGQDRQVRFLEARLRGQLIGLMPTALEMPYGRIPVIFTQNWCHHQMFLGTPLIQAGLEEKFWTAIIEYLDSARWAWSFLHVRNLAEDGSAHIGLQRAAARLGRDCSIVHRRIRAVLQSDLDPATYFERSVRQKKRKEIKRLRNRLSEMGEIRMRSLASESEVEPWSDHFLRLEQQGWKGKAGSALASRPESEACFRELVSAAWKNGRLQFLRLDLGERPLAMLVNLLSPPGSFSFKTCFDEEYARFSPGVLLQIENLAILERDDIEWMDSCAMEDHPMIDHLWSERRSIVRVTVPLAGFPRKAVHSACRAAETAMSKARSRWS